MGELERWLQFCQATTCCFSLAGGKGWGEMARVGEWNTMTMRDNEDGVRWGGGGVWCGEVMEWNEME